MTTEHFRLEAYDSYGYLKSTVEALEKVNALPANWSNRKVGIVDDPLLPMDVNGRFRNSEDNWVEIALNPYNAPIIIPSVVAHETGHLIDAALDGFRGGWASQSSQTFANWRLAVSGTRSVKELRDAKAGLTVIESPPDEDISRLNMVEYLLRDHEIFARCYVQYVTLRSEDARLKGWQDYHLQDQSRKPFPTQWEEDDFVPVANEMDRIFEDLGWR